MLCKKHCFFIKVFMNSYNLYISFTQNELFSLIGKGTTIVNMLGCPELSHYSSVSEFNEYGNTIIKFLGVPKYIKKYLDGKNNHNFDLTWVRNS